MESKKLYRSNQTRTIAGVAGGLSEHFNIDPVLVRIVFVLATLFGGGGLIIYIVLWIVIPEKPTLLNNNVKAEEKDSFQTENNNSNLNDNETISSEKMEKEFETKKTKKNYHGNLTGGIMLITLGILFLIDRFVPEVNFGDLWPVILIVVGATILMRNFNKKNSDNQQ